MQTKWLEKYIKWYLTGTPCTLYNYNGSAINLSTTYPTNSAIGNTMSYLPPRTGLTRWISGTIPGSNNYGVAFGDGDTPPTEEDYTISGNVITSSMVSVTPSITFETDSDGLGVAKGRYVISNISQSPITIKEVAWFACLYVPTATYAFLMDRTVLTEPLTIEAGGVGILTYEIATNA